MSGNKLPYEGGQITRMVPSLRRQ